MTEADLAELEALVAKATPQLLDTAEVHRADEWLECPFCAGEGSVDGETFTNYDGAAIGVQFFGVGDQFVHNEKAHRAVWAALPSLLALARAAVANGLQKETLP